MTKDRLQRGAMFALVVATLVVMGCESSGERLIVPTPRADAYVAMRLTCLYAVSADDVIVGGFLTPLDGGVEGILLRTRDRGVTWRRIGSETHPFTGFVPQSIHFNDALRGWVSGIRNRRGETIPSVLRTDDGGGHWREAEIPESRAAVVTNVSELRFTSDRDGTVHVVFFEADVSKLTANVYETRDGGRNWILADFARDSDEGVTDPAEMFLSDLQGYRIEPPLENGTQVLSFTASSGKVWVPLSQFHVSQFPQFYGYARDDEAPGREEERAAGRKAARRRRR